MDDLKKYFAASTLPKLEALIACAQNLDAEVPSHTLIYVNEEGFMEKAPGPSAFVKKWMGEFANRKQFYSDEELLDWLKKEREREIGHLKDTAKASFQEYYRLLLAVISAEITHISEEEDEEESTASIRKLIITDRLEEAMEELSKFFSGKEDFENADSELVMHQARLYELMTRQRENTIDEDDYGKEKAQIRKAVLQLLKLL